MVSSNTSGFLHYGFVHLAFNMYALWLRPAFERTLGGPFLPFPLSGMWFIWSPNSLTVEQAGNIRPFRSCDCYTAPSGYSIWKRIRNDLATQFVLTFTVSSMSVVISVVSLDLLSDSCTIYLRAADHLPEAVIILLSRGFYLGTLAFQHEMRASLFIVKYGHGADIYSRNDCLPILIFELSQSAGSNNFKKR